MPQNLKGQSIDIKEVLIFNGTCPHCHCTHSQLNKPTKQSANSFRRYHGRSIFYRRPKQLNQLMHQWNLSPAELQKAIASHLQQISISKDPLDWMTSQEVMQLLGISKRKLQTLRNNQTIPCTYLQNKTYYKRSDIAALLEKGYATPKSKTHGTK